MMAENILVCVNYGHHGARLIKRGSELAKTTEANLYILVFDSLPQDDYKNDREVDMSIFKEMAADYGAELIVEESHAHNITKVIKRIAKEIDATQIVIGQRVENLWTALIGGSIIDILLHDIPSADLHVVPKPRADEEEDWNFERGITAYLYKNDDHTYTLNFDHKKNCDYEGVFFKYLQTDFNNGLFAFQKDNRVFEVRVNDGIVESLVDIDEEKDKTV